MIFQETSPIVIKLQSSINLSKEEEQRLIEPIIKKIKQLLLDSKFRNDVLGGLIQYNETTIKF